MEEFRFLGVGGDRSTRRKPKAGMESANQTHAQSLASERKVFEHYTNQPRHWSSVLS